MSPKGTAEGAELNAEGAEVSAADLNALGQTILGSAIRVHAALGPGLLESAYHACLAHELRKAGLIVSEQVPVPLRYDGLEIAAGYRLDILVNRAVVLEIKAVDALSAVHQAQLLAYLKLGGYRLGYLLNFNVLRMKDGTRRLVNGL